MAITYKMQLLIPSVIKVDGMRASIQLTPRATESLKKPGLQMFLLKIRNTIHIYTVNILLKFTEIIWYTAKKYPYHQIAMMINISDRQTKIFNGLTFRFLEMCIFTYRCSLYLSRSYGFVVEYFNRISRSSLVDRLHM